ncbi:bifunctional DNA primase/polymerase-like protein [Halopolyspora algeriensis]|uniref:Bifunctional DNA primase/polymerase-like protein n=1 Tax=Halopolyspora algeriensis TaxID=1500506 RepID=A0A368VGB6_9ACTN|nr:bifunctional DNA primase/polymerase [Halopolyspora algeriensis]RCW40195.1 bifunctional DNA primase/polymerase-like protein [Halopolyspora algeriensis]TQM46323.1 bifunctional DNA primase/polymerase-like protein [Halopolyspora algeriensis]
MDWSEKGWRSAFRIELRAQAIGLASRGWPVLPGTFPANSGWAGRSGADAEGPLPVHSDWQQRLGTNPDQVASWWSGRPYSLLVATGQVVGAVEVDAGLGRSAAVALRSVGMPVPIVATPDGRWYFLTRGDQEFDGELAAHPGIHLHGSGSWIPMPPSTFPQGVVHWRVAPQVCGWQLPAVELVQEALYAGLHERPDVAILAVTE